MALLFSSSFSLISPASSFVSGLAATQPSFRLLNSARSIPKSSVRSSFSPSRGAVIVKASSEVDGTDSAEPESVKVSSDTDKENASLQNLPLASTLELNLEQKMRMKIAKKIRLRRKRLLRKRHLRKKGRWPPSKMKKNKNV